MDKKIVGILILFCRSFIVNLGVNIIIMQDSIFCVGKLDKTSVGLMAPHDVNNGTQLVNGAGFHFQMHDAQTLVEGFYGLGDKLPKTQTIGAFGAYEVLITNPGFVTNESTVSVKRLEYQFTQFALKNCETLENEVSKKTNTSLFTIAREGWMKMWRDSHFRKMIFSKLPGKQNFSKWVEMDNIFNRSPVVSLTQPHKENDYVVRIGDSFSLKRFDKRLESPQTDVVLGMVVQIKSDSENQMWEFLQPFSTGMWCTTVAFMTYTAVVVWLLEHKIDAPANGVRSVKEAIAFIWFSVSTMSFTQRERVESNLARIVIVVWLLVMFNLGSSYTSNFTLRLAARSIKPSFTSVKELLDRDVAVGYRYGSYIGDYVQKNFHIRRDNLKAFNTPEEYAVALSKGPEKGGVAAIFDEIPYVRIFLSGRHGYTMVEPTYTLSWGFDTGFPKDSPTVGDISTSATGIISDSGANPNRLGVENFLGLFLITGTTSTLALIIFFCNLLCKNGPWTTRQETNKWKLIKLFTKKLIQKIVPSVADTLESTRQTHVPPFNSEDHHGISMGTIIPDSDENASLGPSSVSILQATDNTESVEINGSDVAFE